MAKFKKGDRVRRVSGPIKSCDPTPVGGINTVDQDDCNIPYALNQSLYGGRSVITEYEYVLANDPIPDTVTIGGVEYVRKPEPEHVWAWGQWARVKEGNAHYSGQKVFILGGVDETGHVPFTSPDTVDGPVDGFEPVMLDYLGTATIPS